MQYFHRLLKFPAVEVEKRFYFAFTGVQEKKKFSGGENQNFEL